VTLEDAYSPSPFPPTVLPRISPGMIRNSKIMGNDGKVRGPLFFQFHQLGHESEDARSMCCRLRIDNRELQKRGGGLFGSNPLTGSIGVITINMPRIGYLADTEKAFMERLDKLMVTAKESLEIKRKCWRNSPMGTSIPTRDTIYAASRRDSTNTGRIIFPRSASLG